MSTTKKLVTIILVLGVVSGIALGVFLSNSVEISGEVPLHAPSGPAVILDVGTTDINLTDPYPASDTVNVTSAAGNMTATGSDFANVTVTNIEGTWTNTTSIDVIGKTLTLDPDDKANVTLAGDITSFEWRSMTVDDTTPDFTYTSTLGSGTVTLTQLPANTQIGAIDDTTGDVLDVDSTDGDGEIVFGGLDSGSHTVVLATGTSPVIDNSSATPDGDVITATPTLSIDVNDTDFNPGDDVQIEWYIDGSVVNTENITSNQTVTHTTSVLTGGDHTWHITATDAYGNTETSQTFNANTPANVTIREETEPHDIVNNAQATITVTGSDETVDRRTVTDGNISLVGLPTDENYVILVNATGYHTRSIYIDDLFEQTNIFVLNKSLSSVDNTITVQDTTGLFDDPVLIVQKPINESLYDSSGNGEYEWMTIAGDRLGANGEYLIDLRQDNRYRFRITQGTNARILGEYTAASGGVVTLTVEQVTFTLSSDTAVVTWDFTLETLSGGSRQVRFSFNDSETRTEDLSVLIYERGNASNVLHDSTQPGPFGTVSIVEAVPVAYNESDWVVEWSAERNPTLSGSRLVGPNVGIGIPLSSTWKHTIGIGLVLLIGGLASQVNAPAVAVAGAGTAGILFYVSWLPTEVAGGMIALAFAIPAFYIVRGGRL